MVESGLSPHLEFLALVDNIADERTGRAVVSRMGELISETTSDETATRAQLVRTIDRVPNALGFAPKDALGELKASLKAAMETYPGEAQTMLHGLITLEECLPSGDVEADVRGFLESAEPEAAGDFIEREIPRALGMFGPEVWLEVARERIDKSGDEDESYREMVTLLKAGSLLKDRARALAELRKVVRDPSRTNYAATVSATRHLLEGKVLTRRGKTDRAGVEEIVAALFHGIGTHPAAPTTANALDTAMSGLVRWEVPRKPLIECLNTLIQTQSDEARETLGSMVRRVTEAGVLAREEWGSVVESLVSYLDETAPATVQQLAHLFDTLVVLRDAAPSQRDEIYRVMRGYSRPDGMRPSHVPLEYRGQSYEDIARLAHFPRGDASHEVGEMLQEAKGSPDESLRTVILEALADLRGSRIVPRSRHWREIREYVEGLGEPYSKLAGRFVSKVRG